MTIDRKRFGLVAFCGLAALAVSVVLPDRVDAHTRITTDVTWSGEVRAILAEKCMGCHHPGGIAPDYVDLTVYGTDTEPGARAWAVAIEEMVLTGKMPPWQADARFSSFSNAHRLTQEEEDILIAWIRGGAPQGPQRDLPPPPEVLENDWSLAEPDVVVQPPKPCVLKEDTEYATHTVIVPLELEEDTYVTGYEFLPENPKFVKSMTAYIHDPEGFEPEPIEVEVQLPYDPLADEDELESTRMRPMPEGPHFLGTWFRGDGPMLFPETSGRLLRAGSSVELIIEYERPAFAEYVKVEDTSKLGLFTAYEGEEIDLLLESKLIENSSFTIPANASDHRVTASLTLDENVHLVNIAPRMNRLGSRLEVRIVYPDGLERVLLNIPDFDFRWNSNYTFESPVAAPAGTTLLLTGWFDNSEDNWDNPNSPPADVSAGEGRYDEVLMAMVDYTLDDHLYVEEVFVPDPDDDVIRRGGGMGIAPLPLVEEEEEEAPLQLTELVETISEEKSSGSTGEAADEREIYWCPMRGNPCELRDYYEPGECPECWMELKPKSSFFEGMETAPTTYGWPLTVAGQEDVYWCRNRGNGDHELVDYPTAGYCPVDNEPLLHKSRFEPVRTYTCLTPACDMQKQIFYGPGLCPSCGQPVTGMGHMDHTPVHGGWQFFMADNMYHHLEGVMTEPGRFKLYFYDDWKTPLDARNFRATVYVMNENPDTGEVTEEAYPMYVDTPGDEFMVADLPAELPLSFYAMVWLAGEEKRYDFVFEELTSPQTAPELEMRLHAHDCPPVTIPAGTNSRVAMIVERMAVLQDHIDAEEWLQLHCPAYEAKDAMEALGKEPGDLNIRQVGRLKKATALINQGALALDRAGDAKDAARVHKALETFSEGVALLREVYPDAE